MIVLSAIQSPLDVAVRQHLAAYLGSEIDLPAFKQWFVAHTWDVEREGNRSDIALVHDLQLRLIEFSNGDWTEDELRTLLRPVLQTYRAFLPGAFYESSDSMIIAGPGTQTLFAGAQSGAASW